MVEVRQFNYLKNYALMLQKADKKQTIVLEINHSSYKNGSKRGTVIYYRKIIIIK